MNFVGYILPQFFKKLSLLLSEPVNMGSSRAIRKKLETMEMGAFRMPTVTFWETGGSTRHVLLPGTTLSVTN